MLDERYAVGPVLGRGGFGITYLVEDLARGNRAVVNELAPLMTSRGANDDIVFLGVGPAAAQRLRHQFTAEARQLQRIRVPRVPQYRSVFHEHQTAYYATDFIEGARPLTDLVAGTRQETLEVVRLLELLMETLEGLHNHGILHRDIKPSNILLAASGEPYLVDFGSARQWHADLTIAHALQFPIEYASPEQLSEKARRTAATDLYGLGATTYALLAGCPPASVPQRRDGAELVSLATLRPDLDAQVANAIESMLALHPEDRPQSVQELRALLFQRAEASEQENRVRALDARRRRLRKFRYDPMQCPACGDVMAKPEPLAQDVCPVCRDGKVRTRRIETMGCPSCTGGILRRIENTEPLKFCPGCSIGRMVPKRKLLKKVDEWVCEACEFSLRRSEKGATDKDDNDKTWTEWRAASVRQAEVFFCEACLAQYDALPDGRWQRMTQDLLGAGWTRLYPDEWARVAAGLAPDAGNAFCESCLSDFFIADGYVTLLSDPANDPYGFAGNFCGELVPAGDLPFLAVGKESGKDGLVCPGCRMEFDFVGSDLDLVRSSHPLLRRHTAEVHSLKDWHRIAQDLPKTGDEGEIQEDMANALVEAYELGEVGFDPRDADLVWRGTAHEVNQGEDAGTIGRAKRLHVDDETVTLGGPFRKRVELVRDVQSVAVEGDVVTLYLLGGEKWSIWVEPVKLNFKMESGRDTLTLDAVSLARRLTRSR